MTAPSRFLKQFDIASLQNEPLDPVLLAKHPSCFTPTHLQGKAATANAADAPACMHVSQVSVRESAHWSRLVWAALGVANNRREEEKQRGTNTRYSDYRGAQRSRAVGCAQTPPCQFDFFFFFSTTPMLY